MTLFFETSHHDTTPVVGGPINAALKQWWHSPYTFTYQWATHEELPPDGKGTNKLFDRTLPSNVGAYSGNSACNGLPESKNLTTSSHQRTTPRWLTG